MSHTAAVELGEKDLKILGFLQKNARMPLQDIAKEINVSEATVGNRLKALFAKGVIKKATVELAPEFFGYELLGSFGIGCKVSKMDKAAEELISIHNIYELWKMSGSHSFTARAKFKNFADQQAVIKRIKDIDGIKECDANTTITEVISRPRVVFGQWKMNGKEVSKGKFDKTDLKILEFLQGDARASLQELANAAGTSDGTAHNRLQKLREQGAIRRFTLDIDEGKFGYKILGTLGIDIAPGKIDHVMKEMSKLENITELWVMGGHHNASARSVFKKFTEVTEFMNKLNKIEGLEDYDFNVVVEEIRTASRINVKDELRFLGK